LSYVSPAPSLQPAGTDGEMSFPRLGIVKPANIMLDKHGNCKLGDFGVAKLEVFEGQKVEGHRGTPAYMAPEVIISFCFKLIFLYFLQ